jgi:hypothetical protein
MATVVKTSRCLLVFVVLCSCTHLATVHPLRAPLTHYTSLPAGLAVVQKRLSEAQRVADKQPLVALGDDLAAAQIAAMKLHHGRSESEARELYNFAVARSVENLQRAVKEPWHHPVNVPSQEGTFILSAPPPPPDPERDPWNYLLVPADTIKWAAGLLPLVQL